jgi:TnpA family transposase
VNCASATARARRIALGLVVNAIILWNTIYMDAALD